MKKANKLKLGVHMKKLLSVLLCTALIAVQFSGITYAVKYSNWQGMNANGTAPNSNITIDDSGNKASISIPNGVDYTQGNAIRNYNNSNYSFDLKFTDYSSTNWTGITITNSIRTNGLNSTGLSLALPYSGILQIKQIDGNGQMSLVATSPVTCNMMNTNRIEFQKVGSNWVFKVNGTQVYSGQNTIFDTVLTGAVKIMFYTGGVGQTNLDFTVNNCNIWNCMNANGTAPNSSITDSEYGSNATITFPNNVSYTSGCAITPYRGLKYSFNIQFTTFSTSNWAGMTFTNNISTNGLNSQGLSLTFTGGGDFLIKEINASGQISEKLNPGNYAGINYDQVNHIEFDRENSYWVFKINGAEITRFQDVVFDSVLTGDLNMMLYSGGVGATTVNLKLDNLSNWQTGNEYGSGSNSNISVSEANSSSATLSFPNGVDYTQGVAIRNYNSNNSNSYSFNVQFSNFSPGNWAGITITNNITGNPLQDQGVAISMPYSQNLAIYRVNSSGQMSGQLNSNINCNFMSNNLIQFNKQGSNWVFTINGTQVLTYQDATFDSVLSGEVKIMVYSGGTGLTALNFTVNNNDWQAANWDGKGSNSNISISEANGQSAITFPSMIDYTKGVAITNYTGPKYSFNFQFTSYSVGNWATIAITNNLSGNGLQNEGVAITIPQSQNLQIQQIDASGNLGSALNGPVTCNPMVSNNIQFEQYEGYWVFKLNGTEILHVSNAVFNTVLTGNVNIMIYTGGVGTTALNFSVLNSNNWHNANANDTDVNANITTSENSNIATISIPNGVDYTQGAAVRSSYVGPKYSFGVQFPTLSSNNWAGLTITNNIATNGISSQGVVISMSQGGLQIFRTNSSGQMSSQLNPYTNFVPSQNSTITIQKEGVYWKFTVNGAQVLSIQDPTFDAVLGGNVKFMVYSGGVGSTVLNLTVNNVTINNVNAPSNIVDLSIDSYYPASDDLTAFNSAIADIQQKVSANPNNIYRLNLDDKTYSLNGSLVMSSLSNVILDGHGATLMNTTRTIALYIGTGQGVTVTNLNIDYNPLPFTQGVIKSINGNNFTVQIDTGYPTDTTWLNSAQLQGNVYDSSGELIQNSSSTYFWNNVTSLGGGLIGISLTSGEVSGSRNLANGDHITLYSRATGAAILIGGCNETQISNVDIFSSPGSGVEESCGSGNALLNNVRIIPGPLPTGATANRLMSANTDNHFGEIENGPTIIGCWFKSGGDDGLNVQGFFFHVLAITGNVITVSPKWDVGVNVGDTLEGFKNTSFTSVGTATVTAFRKYDDPSRQQQIINSYIGMDPTIQDNCLCYDITLQSPLPSLSVGDQVTCPNEAGKGTFVSNTTVENNRAHGVVVDTYDTVIQNCNFDNNSDAAIVAHADLYWCESGFPNNVQILNNYISRSAACYSNIIKGTSNSSILGSITIGIAPISGQTGFINNFNNQTIVISNNYINTSSIYGIFAANCNGLTISNNAIVNPFAYGIFQAGSLYSITPNSGIFLGKSENATVTNNSVTGVSDSSITTSVTVHSSCTNVTTSGNTFSR